MAWARVALGMREDEFASCSAKRLAAYYATWEQERATEDLRIGLVICSIVNSAPFRNPGTKPLEPSDLFPSLRKYRDAGRVSVDADTIVRVARSVGVVEE